MLVEIIGICSGGPDVSTTETDTFDSDFDDWHLSDRSWQRKSIKTLMEEYPTQMKLALAGGGNLTMKENIVLVPYCNNLSNSDWISSTMTRDLALPAHGELEVLFSVLLLGWNTSLEDSVHSARRKGSSKNPKLQIFYDEDMVFDISTAVAQHKNHYTWGQWNQFKMLSQYREDINITVTVVGCTGAHTADGHVGLVLLDNIVITIRKDRAEDSLTAPRLEPEAELNQNGTWTRIDTEANEEAEDEEKDADRGRPTFCSLLPEIGPCSLKKKRYFYNASSKTCDEFFYGGCNGNENRFSDLEGCEEICQDRELVEPIRSRIKTEDFTTFEDGFDAWVAQSWKELKYDSNIARGMGVGPPPQNMSNPNIENKIGVIPEYHMFDFRQPQIVQEFQIGPDSMLIVEFHLLVKGMGNSGFLSFFLKLDPGFNIYVGNIKVYDFKQHVINDEHWHRYRLTMNKTEVQEHKKESGEEFLLVTIKGWLGSGQKGTVVLDNLNVTHVIEDDSRGSSPDDTTDQSSHPGCLLDKDKGNCSAEFTRYYYSLTADACIQFTWSGCGGNENNHITEEDCLDKCTGSGTTTQPADGSEEHLKDPEEVCAQPAVQGNCKAKVNRFYFEPASGSCQKFVFGGCRGNRNNFRSLEECQEFCRSVMPEQNRNYSPDVRTPSDCTLSADRGSCLGNITMFFFDDIADTCKSFQYGGCLGNGNRFPSLSECENYCGYLTPAPTVVTQMFSKSTINLWTTYPMIKPTLSSTGFNESVCGLHPDKGSCSGNKLRYFYNASEEICQEFHWGGCGGNGNNFLSNLECFEVCQPKEEDFHPDDDQGSATPEEEDPEDDYYEIPVLLPFLNNTDNSPSSVCSTPYDEGPCLPLDPAKYLQRYYHNHTTGTCQLFFYGGCGGNHNNFENKSDCESFCDVVVITTTLRTSQ